MLVNYHDIIRLMASLHSEYLTLRHWIFEPYELIIIVLDSDQSIEFKLFLEYKYRICAQYMRLNKSIFCTPY